MNIKRTWTATVAAALLLLTSVAPAFADLTGPGSPPPPPPPTNKGS